MSEAQSKVSIIMPTYNRVDYIGEAIDSALNQTWQNLELILVDDGSTDSTKEFLEKYKDDARLRYFYQDNQGQSVARNKAIKEAKGDFIAFLDSDNIWYLDKLEKQMKIVAANLDCDIFIGDGITIDEKGSKVECSQMKRYSGHVTGRLIKDNFVSMNTTLTKKYCFDCLGGLDESVKVGDDYELWLRFSTRYKFHYTADNYIKYRVMPNQISSDKERRFMSNETVLNNFFVKFPDAVKQSEKNRGLSFFFVRRARYEVSKKLYMRALKSLTIAVKHDLFWMGPWRVVVLMLLTILRLR